MTSEQLEWGPDEGEMTWHEAVAFAAAKGDGWRLPTVPELVADFAGDDGEPPRLRGWYWSSSSSVSSGATMRAWLVRPCNGNSYDTNMVSYPYRVRCVRSVRGDR